MKMRLHFETVGFFPHARL